MVLLVYLFVILIGGVVIGFVIVNVIVCVEVFKDKFIGVFFLIVGKVWLFGILYGGLVCFDVVSWSGVVVVCFIFIRFFVFIV